MYGCLSCTPSPLGTWPATQAYALTENRTSNSLVHRPALSPLSHTHQGSFCLSVPHSSWCWVVAGTSTQSSVARNLEEQQMPSAQSCCWLSPCGPELCVTQSPPSTHCSQQLSCRTARGQKPRWALGLEGPERAL